MAAENEKCKCIVLKADGSSREMEVDMAPGWELKLIGGPVTIIGMFEAIDTIVLGIDPDDMDEAEMNKLPMNTHALPAPLDDEELLGDVVLFRNDENAEPVDLTLAEWKEFCENPQAEKFLKAIELRRQREAALDEDDEEEDFDDEEEDGEGDDDEGDEEDDDEEDDDEEPSPKKKATAAPAGEKGAKRSKA